MKRTVHVISFLLMFLLITSCSSAGGISTYTIPVEKMPSDFDPQSATAESDLLVITNIFDGLFEKQNDEIVNNLAESYSVSPDGCIYTITIRTDSVWHCKTDKEKQFDGTTVTAQDFVFSFRRILDPKTKSAYAKDFMNIKNASLVNEGSDSSLLGVKAINDYTLEIELEQPDYNFIEKLCSSAVFPCNEAFFYTTGGAYGLSVENILSNGPFKLNYIDSSNATILKNSDSNTSLERIRLILTEVSDQAQSYADEKISGYFTYGDVPGNLSATESQVFDSEVISLVFNLSNNQLKNENIRQALSWYVYAYTNSGANPDAVSPAESIFPGTITLAGKYIREQNTPSIPEYMSANPKDLYQAGIHELGISKLRSLTLLLPENSSHSVIYENINQLWQKNFDRYFKIEYLSVSEIKQRIANNDFDLAIFPQSPDGDSVYNVLENYTSYDAELMALTDTAKSFSDQNKALSYVIRAEKIILEKAYMAPIGSEKMTYCYRDYFKEIYVDPFTGVINLKHAVVG